MVGLMGAQFSKPLVANKVTHLICYKFEGAVLVFSQRSLALLFLMHIRVNRVCLPSHLV